MNILFVRYDRDTHRGKLILEMPCIFNESQLYYARRVLDDDPHYEPFNAILFENNEEFEKILHCVYGNDIFGNTTLELQFEHNVGLTYHGNHLGLYTKTEDGISLRVCCGYPTKNEVGMLCEEMNENLY